ncbi:hypothetical protein DNH61_07020 [Paenibacillus sambharensis]|uniref:Uncharacterized protein n=1 Tax=Paenibacillus sambharensis TaxID=1803190 RepID=A0A2W1LYG0_9BACL|nr:hypothetical protein [Paenibacillus sambharensis]PZD96547.1 hypothetical protein DNH61_07020 [Paenibacillus sambharensis]
MKKFLRRTSVAALAVFALTTFSAYASEIPSHVQDMADSKVSQKQPIPEIRAWETDMNGNKREVVPLSKRSQLSQKGVSIMAPPSGDGYTYSFDSYQPNITTRDWRYKNLGTFRYVNGLSTVATIQYEQQNSTTGTWSVGANISGSTTIKAAFLGKISVEIGGSWDTSREWTKGTKYGASQPIPAKTTAYLTNYQVAANSKGVLVWKKYAPGGTSQVGQYTETAGGYAVSKSDINVEVTSTEPVR